MHDYRTLLCFEIEQPGFPSSSYGALTPTCVSVPSGTALWRPRLHVRRSSRSRTSRFALRPFLRRGAGGRPRALARVGRLSQAPDAPRPPVALSNLLVAMAPHVSRFVTRLFDVGSQAAVLIAQATRAQDDLFRFKVDFVRRRALPLLKGGAHASTSTPRRRGAVDRRRAGRRRQPAEPDRAIVELGDRARRLRAARSREDRQGRRLPPTIESLKRWCAARAPRSARIAAGSSSAFPRTLDYWHLVARAAARADAARAMLGPDWRLAPARRLQADRRAHGAARGAERDPLLHLCHERDKDSCSKGLRDEGRRSVDAVNPLGIELDGCPLDEKISEMHVLRKQGDADRRAGARHDRQPDVPGHRPPHLQRLHEVVHLPEAGAGQHPADRDRRADRRARACRGASRSTGCSRAGTRSTSGARTRCRTTARTSWSSASARRATRWRTTW